MKSQIIQIGNSQGIRIPKVLLEESGIQGDVELELCEDGILIRNIQKARARWEDIFKSVAEHEDEDVRFEERATAFDEKEWQW